MLKFAQIISAVIGVEETLILFACIAVVMALTLTRGLRRRLAWARALGRIIVFAPVLLALLLVLYGWKEGSKTIDLLQRTSSLTEVQANVFWREIYSGCVTTLGYGVFATSLFVFLQRRRKLSDSVPNSRSVDSPEKKSLRALNA